MPRSSFTRRARQRTGLLTGCGSVPWADSPFKPKYSPRESERVIFRDDGTFDPIETAPRDFLALLAESVTLTIQGAADQLARDMAWQLPDRPQADAQIGSLQRLIEDRRLVLAAVDGFGVVPRGVLERHAWLAVQEALLNARDAPESWDEDRVLETERAARLGAEWLQRLGLSRPVVSG